MTHELESAGLSHGGLDVVHVGLGPDAHVCSLFPGHPAALAVGVPAVAVRNSPKPPSERYSLTFDALQRAGRSWWWPAVGVRPKRYVWVWAAPMCSRRRRRAAGGSRPSGTWMSRPTL